MYNKDIEITYSRIGIWIKYKGKEYEISNSSDGMEIFEGTGEFSQKEITNTKLGKEIIKWYDINTLFICGRQT